MKNILENLWFNYIIEIPMKKTNKEKETISEWSKKRRLFLFNAGQRTNQRF